ncbi:MAG TPA: VanZ family protein [Candidatus Limnocylindrales bacterium]|nr:VanZ family protein [Candidatus Limnocylindrales bacterium]
MIRLISALFLGAWLLGTLAFTLRAAHPLPGQVVTDNLVPFTTIRIYLDNLQSPFWQAQAIGNVLLLLPLGLFGPLALPWLGRWWRVLLVAALFSGCIELTQLAIPDRSADVDDVLLNAIGALLGYLLLVVLRLRPRPRRPVPLQD